MLEQVKETHRCLFIRIFCRSGVAEASPVNLSYIRRWPGAKEEGPWDESFSDGDADGERTMEVEDKAGNVRLALRKVDWLRSWCPTSRAFSGARHVKLWVVVCLRSNRDLLLKSVSSCFIHHYFIYSTKCWKL
jgi:hypothetical protein